MSNVRFMHNNFFEGATISYSSQLSSQFSAANAVDQSRSKVWRFGGNFEIDATNNKLYINDDSDVTVTLTSGTYTGTTLAIHVQAQLNAASSGWTCVWDGDYTYLIVRGSGTGVLRLSQTTNAVWDTLGYVGTTDRTTGTFPADEQRNHTSEWVSVDLGVAQLATFAAVLSPIDEVLSLSATATVKVQANNVDSFSSPPVDITVPIGDLAAMKFLDDDVSVSYRYWRVQIIDRTNTAGPTGVEIAHIYVGDDVSPTARNIAPGFTKTLVDPSNVLQSENGALFTETKARYLAIESATIQLLSGDDQRALEQVFYDVGVRLPFYVSFDPDLLISESLDELTRYMVMARSPRLDHVFRSYYNVAFEMREAF